MQEQRLTLRMLRYWNLIRKDKKLPEMERLNTAPIIDLWPQCFVVSVDSRHRVNYKYEYIGEAITKAYGRDLTGKEVDATAKQFPGVVMYKKLEEIVGDHQPREDEGYFVSDKGKMIKYRACYLPFGPENKEISHIVVGLSFRAF